MHSLAAKCFYGLISNATGIDMSHSSDFKLLDRKAVNVLINMPEKNAFLELFRHGLVLSLFKLNMMFKRGWQEHQNGL